MVVPIQTNDSDDPWGEFECLKVYKEGDMLWFGEERANLLSHAIAHWRFAGFRFPWTTHPTGLSIIPWFFEAATESFSPCTHVVLWKENNDQQKAQ